LGEPTQRQLAVTKVFRHQSLDDHQRSLERGNAPAGPSQRPRQLNLQAPIATGRLQTVRRLHGTDHRFDLGQGARQARRQTVRQQTEGAMPLGAIPAGNQSSRRGETFIRTLAGKPAATSRVQRTTPQTCCWLTYSSPVRSHAKRSCTGHGPARRLPWRASLYP
jgi:hypothetical protein